MFRFSASFSLLAFLVVFQLQAESCFGDRVVRDKRSDDMGATEAVLATLTQKVSQLEAELQAAKNGLTASQTQLNSVQNAQGSTFVRWGRSTCPAGATVIYSGIAGGSHNGHTGGGTNRVCLTTQPVFDSTPLDTYFGVLEGAQYYLPSHHYTDVLCAVCRTSHSSTFMVPGTNRCPAGAAEQYHGYLTSGDHTNPQGSEFLCLDAAPEDRPGSQAAQESCYFEHVRTHCGSLICPPYAENKVLTCVVCSV